jgi:succinate dehydrogenase / fumarate reductase, cytochrome b subunit
MGTSRKLFTSSIGRKALVAATGGFLVLFVLAHMVGNLNAFLGPDAINGYADRLRKLPGLLWTFRIGLVVAFVLHSYLGFQLAVENRRARPEKYHTAATVRATLTSRLTLLTGLFVLGFLLLHLAHFTLGLTHPEYLRLKDPLGRHDVYSMLVLAFRQWQFSLVYLLAVAFLAGHLWHGLPALFQTLGWNGPRFAAGLRRFGIGFALVIFAGYAALPVAVALNLLKLAGEP